LGKGGGREVAGREQGAGRREGGSREQGAGSREQGAGSREQGAGSREQGAGSREQGAGSREQEEQQKYKQTCHLRRNSFPGHLRRPEGSHQKWEKKKDQVRRRPPYSKKR
jgi:hypothetical protein